MALIGATLLFLGVFMPIVHIPLMGNISYFYNGRGDGLIILGLAVWAATMALRRDFRRLWLAGTGALAVLAFTFVNFHVRMSAARAALARELAGNPFRGLGDLAFESVQLQWGWGFLLLGALLVLVASSMREDTLPPQASERATDTCPAADS